MSCTYYRWNGGVFGDYWCDKKDTRVDSDTYSRFCRDWNYGECPIYKANTSSSGCFITTIVCDILGKDDNCQVLNNIRFLRENILKKDSQYFSILMDYDHIGPLIACSLDTDNERNEMATKLYENVLSKISTLIEKKEYQVAIDKYQEMVLSLINYYGLTQFYNQFKENNYDFSTFDVEKSGHGRVLRKTHNQSPLEA